MLNSPTENYLEDTDVVGIFLKNIKLLSFDETFNANPLKYPSWEMMAVEGLVLKRGVPINTTDKNGATLLMWASEKGHRDILQFLLNCGADPELTDHQGQTALIKAAINERVSIVDLLLKIKVDTEKVDNLGNAALTYAVLAESNYRTKEIAILLIEHQQKRKVTQNQQAYAERFAADFALAFENGREQVVVCFLKHKPALLTQHEDYVYKAVAKNNGFLTGIFLKSASLEMRKKLFAYRDETCKTALEIALQRGHLQCVRCLLNYEDDILKLKNPDDQRLIRTKLENKHWGNMLKQHAATIKIPQNFPTLTLTELSAEIVSQQAEQYKVPLNKLPLPEELVMLCQNAPQQCLLRTHVKKSQQKQAFIANEFVAYEAEMREKPVPKKRRLKK